MTGYADVEAVVLAWVGAVDGVADASVEMPTTPPLPFVLVTRVSGADDYVTDRAVVDVEVFTGDRSSSYTAATAVHARMLTLRGQRVGGALVDYVEVITGPAWLNYDDELLERHLSSYRIDLRAS